MALPHDDYSDALHKLFTEAQRTHLAHLKWLDSRNKRPEKKHEHRARSTRRK